MSNASEMLDEAVHRLRNLTHDIYGVMDRLEGGVGVDDLEKIRKELDTVTDALGCDVYNAVVDADLNAEETAASVAAATKALDGVADLIESQDAGRPVSAGEIYQLRLSLRDAGYYRVEV